MNARFEQQKSVCVFCGSREGADPAYLKAARDVGKGLASAGFRLVYGAGDVGMMGEVARAARDQGGETFGVIPTHLIGREGQLPDLSHLVITENMHERKKVMFMNADAVVTLPGGPGSLDELFEVMTWAQLGLHDKPMFLLNTNGYWDPLLSLLDNIVANRFADQSFVDRLDVVEDSDQLMRALSARLS